MKNIILSFTLLFSVLFSVAQSAETSPRVVFGDLKHDGPYDRSEILLQEQLNVSSDDDTEYKITSYHLTIYPQNGNPIRYEVEGYAFPAKLQGALNMIVAGDKVLVESIVAKSEDTEVKLKPIVLVVKGFTPAVSEPPVAREDIPNIDLSKTAQPTATFGSITDFSVRISLDDILAQTSIEVDYEGEEVYTVNRFKMIAAYKNSPPRLASGSGNEVTEAMVKMLSEIKSGDRLIIEAITATTEVDGTTYKANLSPIVITVR